MLSADILNSDATYNSYNIISTLEFIPGEQINFVMQPFQSQHPDDLRYMTVAPATIKVFFPTKTGTLEKTLTPFTEDRSIWYVELSELETAELVSGTVTFDIDVNNDGTQIIKGSIQSALEMIITGDC